MTVAELSTGQTLFHSGDTNDYVYFPIDSIVALMCNLEDGTGSEFAMVGNEGLVGIFTFMSDSISPDTAIVQCKGHAIKIKASILIEKFNQSGLFRKIILKYAQSVMTQAIQSTACFRHHSIEQQICRILLLCLDRINSYDVLLTQEFISRMLGVRREGVTLAAIQLQKLGVINYSRGKIRVMDRSKLIDLSCECYEVMQIEHHRLFPTITQNKNYI